jgi:high-affinity iron transporter
MLLVSTFIIWMIRHGENMVNEVQRSTRQNLSAWGLFALALVMVSREGAEIAVFAFAGKYSLLATGLGVGGALVLTTLAIRSIIRVPLASILRYTLIYLVLQSGYLIGYGVHEGLSALKSFGVLSGDLFIYQKAFDLSQGVLSHKDGLVGLPLNILFGWYSKPEWVQFIVQYGYTLAIFGYWISFSKGSRR